MKTIFIVDDNDVNLIKVKEALAATYRVITISSAKKMFSLIAKITPDLILLDINMPEIDGFSALKKLKESEETANIPVIFLTGYTDENIETQGFKLGAVDFLTKPYSNSVLIHRLETHLNIDGLVKKRTARIQELKNGIIAVISDMVENRDRETGGHIERTTKYIKILIDKMIMQGVYKNELSGLNLPLLITSASLHDVGKIAISDTILNKKGKLTDEELEIMKTHAKIGMQIIDKVALRTRDDDAFLQNAKLFAGYHHERWDGKGYPFGLEGTNIPLQGRLMAIADVYDALISIRPYKKSFTHDETVNIIMESAEKQFDPSIAGIFYSVRDEFDAVKSELVELEPR